MMFVTSIYMVTSVLHSYISYIPAENYLINDISLKK